MRATARLRLAACAASACVSLVLAASASRADDGPRVVAFGTGPDGEGVAAAVASRAAPASAGDSDAFRAALGASGARLVPQAAKHRDKAAELTAKARAAARAAHADKAILVFVEKPRGKTSIHVWVVDAQGGPTVADEAHLGGGAAVSDESDAAWSAVSSAFPPPPEPARAAEPAAAESPAAPEGGATAAPASSAPAVAGSGPDADTAPLASGPHPRGHTWAGAFALLGLSMQGASRHFSYVDRLTPSLRPYDLFVAPRAEIHGEVYPFRDTSIPVLAQLGATGSYAIAFGLASADSNGTRVGTSWHAFDLGLRERLPIGTAFVLGIDAGFGDDRFAFDDAIRPGAQLPDVHYTTLHGGLDGRLSRGDLSFALRASYLDVLGAGDVATLFPHASVGGATGGLEVADAIAPGLQIAVDVAYTRFFYDLKPVPGDAYVAGGALDEMAALSLGIAYLF